VSRPGEPPPGDTTVAAAPPWRERPTWGFEEGDELAAGRTVLRRLGGGRRYEVYLVWDDARLAVLVAKLLRPDQAGDTGALGDLRREADALAQLAHPVVVRGFDAVLSGHHPHLLIEHLEGPTLRALLDETGPLALEQLLPLALHVAAALHYMTGEGWVHLDVKPDNIVMGVPPRLIDLSVARTITRARRATGPIGTDAYMAPEQCDPATHGPVGPAADVFGLGATLYRAATGRRPFPNGNPDAGAPAERWPQLASEPDPGPLPDLFAEPILACLARKPESRPGPADVADALEPILEAQSRPRLSGLKPRWR
jgi:eukaryotic-like serine/threonine-protein kinase